MDSLGLLRTARALRLEGDGAATDQHTEGLLSRTNLGRRLIEREPTAMAKPLPAVAPSADQVEIGLTAAVVAVIEDEPKVLLVERGRTADGSKLLQLPTGMFSPSTHVTLEAGVRSAIADWAAIELRGVEQLMSFAEQARSEPTNVEPIARLGSDRAIQSPARLVSVGYLALTSPAAQPVEPATQWTNWYDILPWEDWRKGRPRMLSEQVEPRLRAWADAVQPGSVDANAAPAERERERRLSRLHDAFGPSGSTWDVERIGERLELMREAGLVGRPGAGAPTVLAGRPGIALDPDHLRILAAAIGRLRSRIKSQPVVFELLNNEFTLFELQKTVEAVLGPNLHKQNFRRLVANTGLIEATRDVRVKTGGRPARLYRYRSGMSSAMLAPGSYNGAGKPAPL
jgi:hypothetical protein